MPKSVSVQTKKRLKSLTKLITPYTLPYPWVVRYQKGKLELARP